MTQSTLNTRLIDSLTQIILSLSEAERQILAHQIQVSLESAIEEPEADPELKDAIALGLQQLDRDLYTEYDRDSLPNLFEAIKIGGKKRLKEESAL